MHEDNDFREHRHGSPAPSWPAKPALVRRQEPTEAGRRAHYAKALARAAFGRFFWDDQLARRMEKEMDRSHRLKKERSARRRAKKR
jgi:hypothetical protein